MNKITMIGMDIAKNVFQVCVQNNRGETVEKRRLSRAKVLCWFSQQVPVIVGMEACGGSHYWAREISKLGHRVRILPPQHVKPYVRTNKSDANDAQAICRAMREPDINDIPISDRAQQDMQAYHRLRQRLVEERTALVNQIRGLLLEYGIALPVGLKRARKEISRLLEDQLDALSDDFLVLLQEQYCELLEKDRKVDRYTQQIEDRVVQDPAGVRVMKVAGIGVLGASALLNKLRHAGVYRNGRHFASSLGLVPRHDGTGGVTQTKGMSKRGDRYLRTLLIHGARSVIRHLKEEKKDPMSLWVKGLAERRGANKAAVALASKNARIAWRLIMHEEEYQPEKAAGQITLSAAA